MPLSRRRFLATAAVGTAAAAILDSPAINAARATLSPSTAATTPQAAGPTSAPIILSNNENAYGPLPSMISAMRDALALANRYPDSQYEAYVDAVAKHHGVTREQVIAGNGSSEILRIAVDTFTGPQRSLVMATPTFEEVAMYAKTNSVRVVAVPLTANFEHDLDAMMTAARDGGGLVYICNPNNPTGTLTPRNRLETFIKALPRDVFVLMDEAYHDFATGAPEYVSFLERPLDDPRVVVTRTFSKIYGIAGLRLGYGIAAKETIARMQPHQLLDNLNMIAVQTAIVGLADRDGVRAAISRNSADRVEFLKQANARGLNPMPSYANFVMMDSPVPTPQAIDFFKQRGIAIGRDFHYGQRVRISLGKPEEVRAFWRVWDAMPKA